MTKEINKILKDLFSDFNSKQKKIINDRFGLKGNKRTLQAIGDDLDVTRERVRQIENQSIESIKSGIKKEFSHLIKNAQKVLDNLGGVCRDDVLVKEIKKNMSIEGRYLENKIRFILLVSGDVHFYKENDKVYAFWYKNNSAKKEFFNYLKKVIKFFKKNKEEILENNKVYKKEFTDKNFENFVSISKEFGANAFGDFGLRRWPEIEPKVIRDKAHLILQKRQKPLHFSNIAKDIEKSGVDKNKVHVQTVHNELIKDRRFVLTGRGIYALKSQGYEGGTVNEVIKKILKENGPLSAQRVVELVNQKKILKENTILLNLQNGSQFESDNKGKYHIRKG